MQIVGLTLYGNKDHSGAMIEVLDSAEGIHIDNNRLGTLSNSDICHLLNGGRDGITIWPADASVSGTRAWITGNNIRCMRNSGISVLSDDVVIGQRQNGQDAGNTIRQNEQGIYASGGSGRISNLTIRDNEIFGSTRNGIELVNADIASISFNSVVKNGEAGLLLSNSAGCVILSNTVGITDAGATTFGNGSDGISLINGSTSNWIGGLSSANGNVISGNGRHGINVENSSNTEIYANKIGTNPAGGSTVPNTQSGINLIAAHGSKVGGFLTPTQRNLISGNTLDGVFVNSSANVIIVNNSIGINASRTEALPNLRNGIWLFGSGTVGAQIGNGSAEGNNDVAGNASYGIAITHAGSGNVVHSNRVGIYSGERGGGPPIGNGASGILVQNSSNTELGNSSTACSLPVEDCLIVLANAQHGIALDNADGTQIGRKTVIVGNGSNGVNLRGGTANAQIKPQMVSENMGTGISVLSNVDRQNDLQPTIVEGNAGIIIDLGDDGHTANDSTDGSFGADGYLDFPVVTDSTELNNIEGSACAECIVDIYRVDFGSPTLAFSSVTLADSVNADILGVWSVDLTQIQFSSLGITSVKDVAFVAFDFMTGSSSEMTASGGVATAVGLGEMAVVSAENLTFTLLLITLSLTTITLRRRRKQPHL